MSLFDIWISAVAMFKLGQMNVFIEASLIVVTLPVWQFCLFIINLCCKSSSWCPEQYMQLALACMCAQVDTSCYVTPVCGMFAFSDTIYRLLCLTTGCYEYMHEWPWKCLSMLWASFACRPRSVYLMSLYSWLWMLPLVTPCRLNITLPTVKHPFEFVC